MTCKKEKCAKWFLFFCCIKWRAMVYWCKAVKQASILNNFHVCDSALPPCLAHALFEGVVNQDMCLCLEYLVKGKKWFTFNELNHQVRQFKFCWADNHSMPAIVNVKGKKLGGQAMENYAFMRFMRFFMSHKILDLDDEVWTMINLLHEICLIVMAPAIAKEQLSRLQLTIEHYLELHHDLFPSEVLKPKHQFLFYNLQLILDFGPLVHVWNMQFKSKHSYFKHVACAAKKL